MIKKKIVWNFHGSWFLALDIPMAVTQFGGISRGEASFCLEFSRFKWHIYTFQESFSKEYVLNTPCLCLLRNSPIQEYMQGTKS